MIEEEQKLSQMKGQVEAIIPKLQDSLKEDEFKELCDAVYTISTYIIIAKLRLKHPVNITKIENNG